MSEDMIKKYRRHARAFRIVVPLARPVLRWIFRLESEPATDMQGPFLVYANHNTDLDPALVQLSFKEMIYFVASEHIFRVGLPSRLLVRYFDPISRLKGSTDMGTVRDVMRRLKDGKNVGIFAEGNRSFNGITGPIPPSIGKLAKACKVTLVTYKFEGGYFTTPRWAYTLRRGRMRGYVVQVYRPEQLKEMSAEEISAAIEADLFEDAYTRQATEKVRYRGKRLAEGLETALFICPQCEQIGTLASRGSEFFCTCGLKASYDEYGYLSGAPYSTVTQWDAWQGSRLAAIAQNLEDGPAFGDRNVILTQVKGDHTTETVDAGCGNLAMYRDRIVCGDLSFALGDVSDMALYGRENIAFTSHAKHYVITAGAAFCGRKYLELYNLLQRTR